MTEKALRYLTGFGNEHTSEALKGALPAGQTAQFEWAAHVRLGLQAGLSQERIDAIAERRTPEFDDPDDRFIYEFAHGYYQNHRLSDDIYEQLRARWGDRASWILPGSSATTRSSL
jgi:hypothetical protein